MALIALCLFPLLTPLAAMRRADRKYLEDIQLERGVQNAFCLVKANLCEQLHSWDQLGSQASGELPCPFYVVMSKGSCRTYHCRYTLHTACKDAKKKILHKVGRALTLDLTFYSGTREHRFTRMLYLEKEL